MKTTKLCPLIGLLAGLSFSASSQGFINLDFEQAVIQPHPVVGYPFIDWGLALPGWSGSDTTLIYYGWGHLGTSQMYLMLDSTSPVWAPGTQLEGNYSLAFQSGYSFGPGPEGWVNAYLAQTGAIPSSARSIHMLGRGPFQVLVGGTAVDLVSLGGEAYAGDITAFAGLTVELKLVNTSSGGLSQQFSVVDNIVFSPEPIPEPGVFGWFALGALALGWRLRCSRT